MVLRFRSNLTKSLGSVLQILDKIVSAHLLDKMSSGGGVDCATPAVNVYGSELSLVLVMVLNLN